MVDQAILLVLMLWSDGMKEAQDWFVNRRLGVRFLSPAPQIPLTNLLSTWRLVNSLLASRVLSFFLLQFRLVRKLGCSPFKLSSLHTRTIIETEPKKDAPVHVSTGSPDL
jgi:hypothetical protein